MKEQTEKEITELRHWLCQTHIKENVGQAFFEICVAIVNRAFLKDEKFVYEDGDTLTFKQMIAYSVLVELEQKYYEASNFNFLSKDQMRYDRIPIHGQPFYTMGPGNFKSNMDAITEDQFNEAFNELKAELSKEAGVKATHVTPPNVKHIYYVKKAGK